MEEGAIVEMQPVCEKLNFTSAAGRALQRAVLPAFPRRRPSHQD